MPFEVIRPMGNRPGVGTYDTFFNQKRHVSWQEAHEKGDAVIVNFVTDENGVIWLEIFGEKDPELKHYKRLSFQNFIPSLGIDTRDDNELQALIEKLYP